ncbi:hypothetical protein MY8738_007151 [Beauveria namnaoensis]
MSAPQPPADRKSFRVAILCAMSHEADAVALLFDQFWNEERDPYGRADGDENTYNTGRIGQHHVVLAVLPHIGTSSAAAATASLRSSYTNLKLAILVGICGGIPRIKDDNAFLGDVVISQIIIQYDYGRQYPSHFAIKSTIEDSLGRANTDIGSLLANLGTRFNKARLQAKASTHLKHLQAAAKHYQYPGKENDTLYDPKYTHRHQKGCSVCVNDPSAFCESASRAFCVETGCDSTSVVARERFAGLVDGGDFIPGIFIGRIGSGNTVMKSGEDRDRIAADNDLIAFEMEGAGAWDQVPCIVVKGICDYADSHKNKSWQDFAAATAASVAKAILERYQVHDGDRETTSKNGGIWSFVSEFVS